MVLNGLNCVKNENAENSMFDYRLLRDSNLCDGHASAVEG
jgi:hypothetical protein